MQAAAAGVLAQAPRSLIQNTIEKEVPAPYDAVFQTITRPDSFMTLRKSVSQVIPQAPDETSFLVKEIFMGAQAEFVITVYPYYNKNLIHHYGKASYFCVEASIDYILTRVGPETTHVQMTYKLILPSLLASFSKNIIAKDRKSQLEAISQYATANMEMKVTTPDANFEHPALNMDNIAPEGSKKAKKKEKKEKSKKNKEAEANAAQAVPVPVAVAASSGASSEEPVNE